ncbi:tRNA 2-selenouridine(34) synthase MnmH [Shewanella sp. 10N.286.52.B9]|uniref:tRNA 2-selenouridine(34) synthase MnmH n=1 Tax=unclassified Shewanella TaxID=196818 RepID=UPI000C83FAF0|nr:tRNA 2-selenouridine(34) synthase MnmH [Shewanella sp. 10N.286.52.B9]PMG40775.1 tRNA 2-selenouridine(34) synthase MnmH [Shewanella sp. 10N.286.52.B9]
MPANIIAKTEYQRLFLQQRALIDVRAPIEFSKGAFEHSANFPLMNDSERTKVGTCYKEQGQQAAIELGHQLVNGKTKQQRIESWQQFIAKHPNSYLYCFRGGLRSKLSQQWLKEAGIDIPYIEGGYKAMRQYLIDIIDTAATLQPLVILSGSTGSGKTELLQLRPESIDLEAIANHRGSSFGKNLEPQPTQINFENQLATQLLQHQQLPQHKILLEDESFLIGRSAIPKAFYQAMQASEMIVLEESLANRINRIHKDYVIDKSAAFINKYGAEHGKEQFSQYLLSSINSIKKRLGGKQHQQLSAIIESAINRQFSINDANEHFDWISILLERYYDPMYQYQMSKRQQRVIFSGDKIAIQQYLDQLAG